MHSTHFIYGYVSSDIWYRIIQTASEKTQCRHYMGYSFRLTARVFLYAPSHIQHSTYHGLCYTSCGALAEARNSSIGPPHRIDPTTKWPMSERSYYGATSGSTSEVMNSTQTLAWLTNTGVTHKHWRDSQTLAWLTMTHNVVKGSIEGRKCFYLTTHSTHIIYGYMASDIWQRTTQIAREETCCRHMGYSFRLAAMVLLYASSHRQDNTWTHWAIFRSIHNWCNKGCGTCYPVCEMVHIKNFILLIRKEGRKYLN